MILDVLGGFEAVTGAFHWKRHSIYFLALLALNAIALLYLPRLHSLRAPESARLRSVMRNQTLNRPVVATRNESSVLSSQTCLRDGEFLARRSVNSACLSIFERLGNTHQTVSIVDPLMASRSFSLFLALRYLKPKRTFLSIITLISILGVTLGVMVLILVISVMTGFERELTRKVVRFDAHLMVSNAGVMDDWPDVMKQVSADKKVTAVAPFVQGPVLWNFRTGAWPRRSVASIPSSRAR